MLSVILLPGSNPAPVDTALAPEGNLPSFRANKASLLTRAQVMERIVPRLEKGLTEAQLQESLGTLPVLTGNGELLWVLVDGIVLTASAEGGEKSKITCWGIRSY
jgi:hypothetical protein